MTPRDWRKSLNLTQKELSKKMGGDIRQSYISEIERGEKPPSGFAIMLYHEHSNGLVGPGDFPKTPK
jgi:transcriptional regulator with XRE-family HTH domain